MIVVRDIFQLHFGKAREAKELLTRGRSALEGAGYRVDRLLVDVTGEYYTLVMESRFEDLAAFERTLARTTSLDDWRSAYAELVPLVRRGRREILREVT